MRMSYIFDMLDLDLVRNDASEKERGIYKWQNDSMIITYNMLAILSNEL